MAVRLRGAGVAVFHIAGGTYCEIPAVAVPGGFVRDLLFVAAEKNPAKDPGAFAITVSPVTIYGADCKPVAEWKFRGRIDDLETFAPGLMAIDSERQEIQVVEPVTGKTVARVSTLGGFTRMRFGEKGRVLCGAWYPSQGSLVCYELASGLRVAHATIQGGAPLDVSLENSLALAADGAFWKDPFGGREYETLKRWIVWDFRTGREVASLGFQMQRRTVHTYWRGNLGPCSSAISPDGRQIAVAGDDVLRVYDLPLAVGKPEQVK